MDVYEYFLTNDNEIKGWQIWPITSRPDLSDAPNPSSINVNRLKDVFGNYLYKLVDNAIVEQTPVITPRDRALRRLQMKEQPTFLRALVKGMGDNVDPEFRDLKTDVDESD